MKAYLLILFVFFSSNLLWGQNCACPANNISGNKNPTEVFKFLNGKKVAVCGSLEVVNKEKQYSDFIIYDCADNKILLEFDATQTCTIEKKKDTLIINEFEILANGKHQTIKWTKFYIIKLYWDLDKRFIQKSFFRKDLEKYSKTQVEKVLKEFILAQRPQKNFDKTILIGHRLFWAYVSGSKKAGKYLESFEKKFGPFDGAISEEFNDIFTTYEHFKKIEVQRK